MRLAVYYDLDYGGAANALSLFVTYLRRDHHVDVFCPPGAWPVAEDVVSPPGIGPLPASRLYYWNRVSHPLYYRRLAAWEQRLADRLREYDRVLVHSCRGRGAPAHRRAG